jgi:hypothetical protein
MTKTPNHLDDDGIRDFADRIKILDQVSNAALVKLIWQSDDIDKLL